MIERIERLQRELAAMRDYHQGYLERRTRTGITTSTDTVMTQHQKTLEETLDLLEAMKAMLLTERICASCGEPETEKNPLISCAQCGKLVHEKCTANISKEEDFEVIVCETCLERE